MVKDKQSQIGVVKKKTRGMAPDSEAPKASPHKAPKLAEPRTESVNSADERRPDNEPDEDLEQAITDSDSIPNNMRDGETEIIDRLRESLNLRVRDCSHGLINDLFDELDDFLFNNVRSEDLGEGSPQLKLVREFRNKKQLFLEKFLDSIEFAPSATVVSVVKSPTSEQPDGDQQAAPSALKNMELDLAVERMQRKALKVHAGQIKILSDAASVPQSPRADAPGVESSDVLVAGALCALSESCSVFRVSLDNLLIFFKLFENHFLLKMDKLYQAVIDIVTHQDNGRFAVALYFSSNQVHRGADQRRVASADIDENMPEGSPTPGFRDAASQAQVAVDNWSDNHELPGFVVNMLRNEWLNVLILIGSNKGVGSREWCEASRTVELLLHRLEIGFSITEIGEMDSDSGLLERLRQGFDLSRMDESAQESFFSCLEEYKISSERQDSPTGVAAKDSRSGVKKSAPGSYTAVSEAGRKILDSDDLDDFIALLSDEQEQAIAEVEEEAISMDYYLNMVDAMADGANAELRHDGQITGCTIHKSADADNSYQVLNSDGQVLLIRGRVGLAVSLREGEIRLEGQEDFNGSAKNGSTGLPDRPVEANGDTTDNNSMTVH